MVACGSQQTASPTETPAPGPQLTALSVGSPQMSGAFARASTCDGGNATITVTWSAGPRGTVEYVVLLDDEDATGPQGTHFTHWLVYNIPLTARSVGPGLAPEEIQGRNDFGRLGYAGPCPPPGAPHHYTLHVYALKHRTHVNDQLPWSQLSARVAAMALASGSVTATYQR